MRIKLMLKMLWLFLKQNLKRNIS